jgi:nucleotide-binding universal stress UspA family protein
MADLFERVLLPVANEEDAETTCRALEPYVGASVVACNVVEKAGGAVDKASVEQREEEAEEAFAVVREILGERTAVETTIQYDTDVSDGIFGAAEEFDASAIVFTPRGGSRWVRLLTGDVAMDLITENDRPVVVLPDVSAE